MYITIFAGGDAPFTISLEDYGRDCITFGRSRENDIVLAQPIVSTQHGRFVKNGRDWTIIDNNSSNGLTVNDEKVSERILSNGLKIYIGNERFEQSILFLCTTSSMEGAYKRFDLGKADIRPVLIGSGAQCDICMDKMLDGDVQAMIRRSSDTYYIKALNRNNVRFNGGIYLHEETALRDMDRFMIGDTQFLYNSGELVYYQYKDGISLEASHVKKVVSAGKKKKTIVDDVSLQIHPGEFVAIIGGSGAGKTSLMKCLSGCTSINEGSVLIQGEDIGSGYKSIKQLIGYVPQQDIVYDNLTLERMLYYSAKLRLSHDLSDEDIKKRIAEVISMVELVGHEKTMIRKLSGGQKKRASIAVEFLSNPGILFLDEPTSGLDPGTEHNLMVMLKKMTAQGKTVVLVTHATLNIGLCDRIIFMAPGGRLAYSGSLEEAEKFFGAESIVDIYNMVQQNPGEYVRKFAEIQTAFPQMNMRKKDKNASAKISALHQTNILIRRYCEMILNNSKKLIMMAAMPLALGFAMLAASWGDSLIPFKYSTDTQTFALALACCCFFLGLFQSFQEISDERTIVEREKMADMKCLPYFFSKFIVLAAVMLVQSAILLGFTWLFVIEQPESGVLFINHPFIEFYITTYLTALSAVAIGLAVSAWAKNSEQTLYFIPLLLMLQILFSEVICSLTGAARYISYIVSCQWTCLAYCGSARVNELYVRAESTYDSVAGLETELETGFINARYDFMDKYSVFSVHNPTMQGWVWLVVLSVAFSAAAVLFLRQRREL